MNWSVVSGNNMGIHFSSVLHSPVNTLKQALHFFTFLRPNFGQEDTFSFSSSSLTDACFLTESCSKFFFTSFIYVFLFNSKSNKKQAPISIPSPTHPNPIEYRKTSLGLELQKCHQILQYMANAQGKHMGSMCCELGWGLLFF